MSECNNLKPLLMGLMDDELTSEEKTKVNEHLIRCQSCREEYEELRESLNKLDKVSFVEPTDEVLGKLWKSPFSRATQVSALFLIIGGYFVLLTYSIYEMLLSDEPVIPRITMAAILMGFLILLISVIRERLKTYKVDPYKEVQR